MALSEELQWRGFVNQTTLADMTDLDTGPLTFYWGVDPSSDSMTIGNFAAAMMVRHFIDAGHNAILLVGGATGMIGDPDGKKDERAMLSLEDTARNVEGIAEQYRRVFAGKDFTVVDNYDWFKNINFLDFLRTIGKHVPLSQMLGREFVQSRLGEDGSGINYAEFSYALIQGFDFLHLYREHGATLQLCGADQWGNSIAGVDLIRRLEGGQAHVYSTPLMMNKATGRKFGKSEDGAIWLDEAKTSVYAFYQFWLNADDEGVADYAKIFTLLSRDEIDEIERLARDEPQTREAQRRLAKTVTAIVHGEDRAATVERVTAALFGNLELTALSDEDLEVMASEIPTAAADGTVIDALVAAGFAQSNGEARRLIEGGAVSLNSEKIAADQVVAARTLIKKGKNSFILVR